MKNIVSVSVDDTGEMHVDLSGYQGRSCEFEEAEMRRILAELGLKVSVKDRKSKQSNVTATASTQIRKDHTIKI